MSDLFVTPLGEWHKAHGAKMAPFAGWDMPIQYEGILQEHQHTRTQASLFDICHMGQFILEGKDAAKALALAVSHNLDTLKPGKCRYGFLLTPRGTIMDDLIIYRMGEDKFFFVVNAARSAVDFQTLQERLPGLTLTNLSEHNGKIDLQGPKSCEFLEKTLGESFRDLPYFSFREASFRGSPLLVSRTGYTGELGYELYPARGKTLELWEALLQHDGVKPAGLGARDTLRLEAGLALYGHELDEAHTPAEAGMGAMITSNAPFVGHEKACIIQAQRLLALTLEGRRSARNGDTVVLPDTETVVGIVTSGSFAPSLGQAIALAYVNKEHADKSQFGLKSGKNILNATITELPFYKEGSARIKL